MIGVNSDILSVSVSPVFDPLRKDTASVATLDYAFQPGFYIALLASLITMIGFAFRSSWKKNAG